jgi:hypothetical protein
MSYFLLFLAFALFAAALWALPAIVACIIIWRRLAAFIHRGAGRAHSPLYAAAPILWLSAPKPAYPSPESRLRLLLSVRTTIWRACPI